MLLWLVDFLSYYYHAFNVVYYLTLRALLATLTALFLTLCLGPTVIRWLTVLKVGQVVRDDGPQSHLQKMGTPTMGGALILLAVASTLLLWANLQNEYIWLVLFILFSFGGIGWVDDYRKLVRRDPRGLPARWKFFWQTVFGLGLAIYLYVAAELPATQELLIPFTKNGVVSLGLLAIPFTYLVVVGTSNAVNLTDGLDGLAIGPVIMVGGALGIFAYLCGHATFADYLNIPYIPGTGELVVFCAALVGAGLGFLWFNTYPAQVFMGDVGALGIGAALGTVAVLVRQELVLLIMGGIFVMETISVILQVVSYRLTGRRLFKMAPIHHHFELKGWAEPKVIVRFWIITVVLVLIGLTSLKIR